MNERHATESDAIAWTPPPPGACGSLAWDCDGTDPKTWCLAAGKCGQARVTPSEVPAETDPHAWPDEVRSERYWAKHDGVADTLAGEDAARLEARRREWEQS